MVVCATGGWDDTNVPPLCNDTVAIVKSSNDSDAKTLKRHYETTHMTRVHAKFPPWLPAIVCSKIRKSSAAAK